MPDWGGCDGRVSVQFLLSKVGAVLLLPGKFSPSCLQAGARMCWTSDMGCNFRQDSMNLSVAMDA